MTSSVKITLWGGLPATVKKEVVLVDSFLPRPHSSIMDVNAPAETFFNQLSVCRSTGHLFTVIEQHWRASRHPNDNMQSPYALHFHNPMEYHITEIVVLKRRFVIQHEGFVFRVHHQPGHGPAEPDFLISIDRNIDSTPPRSIFSFHKVAIDCIKCSLAHPTDAHIPGTFRRPVVWRIPPLASQVQQDNIQGYEFNLNLLQVGVLLRAILTWNPNPQYQNCFSHSRLIRNVLRFIIQEQNNNNNVTVAAHEPRVRGATLGKCFCFRLDREDQGESAAIFTTYAGQYTWLTA